MQIYKFFIKLIVYSVNYLFLILAKNQNKIVSVFTITEQELYKTAHSLFWEANFLAFCALILRLYKHCILLPHNYVTQRRKSKIITTSNVMLNITLKKREENFQTL